MQDQWRVTLGGGSYFGREASASLAYQERNALIAGNPNPEETIAAAT